MRFGAVASVMFFATGARADEPVTVHVRGNPRATLERLVPGSVLGVHWDAMCLAPCVVEASRGDTFRIGGSDSGVRPSPSFRILGNGRDVAVDVSLATERGRTIGWALFATGGVGVVVSALVAIGGALANFSLALGPPKHDGDGALTAAGITFGAGSAFMLGGLVFLVANASSRADLVELPPARALGPRVTVRF